MPASGRFAIAVGHMARQLSHRTIAEAIRYGLSRWDGLVRFLDDGRIEIDSNVVERTIRPSPPIARMRSSPDRTAAASTGPSSHRWSRFCKLNGMAEHALMPCRRRR